MLVLQKGKAWILLTATLTIIVLLACYFYYLARSYILYQVEIRIRDVMLECRSLHQYIQENMHPALYRLKKEGRIPQEFYSAEMLSSSYIARHIHQHYNDQRKKAGLPQIHYRLAAINPRNPINKADQFEESLIKMFNQNRSLKEYRTIITSEEKKHLYYAVPFLRVNKKCLKCHGDPQDAPLYLRDKYSESSGYKKKIGQVVAIESISSPLEAEFQTSKIVLTIILIILIIFFLLMLANARLQNLVESHTKALKDRLKEKEVMLKEIHHRVKNNLQVISSLLRMQSRQIQDEQAREYFKDSQIRIQSMALVHQTLYHSEDFSGINLSTYINSITKSLSRSYYMGSNEVKLKANIEDITLTIDQAIPCGLIINELVSNAFKHAFPCNWEGQPLIEINLQFDREKKVELIIRDNGVGMPDNINFKKSDSLGLRLVNILTEQLEGELDYLKEQGTCIRIKFTKVEVRQRFEPTLATI